VNGSYSTHEKMNFKVTDPPVDPSVDGTIILKRILEKWDVMVRNRLNWLKAVQWRAFVNTEINI
jgi:hypothetical protein